MAHDPLFLPGHVRAVLDDLDREIGKVEAMVLGEHWKTIEDVKKLLGTRKGLQMAREMETRRLDDETKKRLGLRP